MSSVRITGSEQERLVVYRKVAEIHCSCINQGFLSSLGIKFLSLLYEAIDQDINSVLLVDRIDGEVVGFVAGGCGMRSIYRHMLRHWFRLCLALLPAIANPIKLKRIIEIVLFSRKQKPIDNCPKAELFSIAVLPSARGQGIADNLYQALAQHFKAAKQGAFCIVVGDGLTPAHKFYQRMGAFPMAKINVHHGEGSTLYRHDLPISA